MSKCGSLANPGNSTYARLQTRIDSFKEAPDLLQKLLPTIAEAGFYYRGKEDRVGCFHCHIILSNWSLHHYPWIEHAYWNPHCPHVLCNKSSKWVRQAFNAHTRMKGSDADWGDLPLDDSGNPVCTQKCRICLERELRIAFLPCGHLCACAMCGAGLTHCPICRKEVDVTVRIFAC